MEIRPQSWLWTMERWGVFIDEETALVDETVKCSWKLKSVTDNRIKTSIWDSGFHWDVKFEIGLCGEQVLFDGAVSEFRLWTG
jgi:hypothetical protein